MTVTRPLITDKIEVSPLYAFDIPFEKYGDYEESLRGDFGLTATQSDTTITISHCDKEYMENYAKTYENALYEVSVSKTICAISEIVDLRGDKVFDREAALYGWLVFVDENILANWGHACKYIFYINRDTNFEVQNTMPPANNIAMEVI
jgi:hypothetical protein